MKSSNAIPGIILVCATWLACFGEPLPSMAQSSGITVTICSTISPKSPPRTGELMSMDAQYYVVKTGDGEEKLARGDFVNCQPPTPPPRQSPPPRPPSAQAPLRPLSDAEQRALNVNRVGVIAGGPGGTYIRIAHDLGLVLDDTKLRVLAHTGRGSVRNILDLLYLEHIDIAIVQDDVLDYVGRLPAFATAGIRAKIAYVTTLYKEEIHVLARGGIRRFQDLANKRVAVDVTDSGTEMTARNLFAEFGISVEEMKMPLAEAAQALGDGQIDALIFVGGKPLDALLGHFREAVVRSAGIGFVTLPHDDPLRRGYDRSTLTAADYPALVPRGEQIETWSVSAVMAVYNWFQPHIPDTHPRRRVTSAFVDSFISNFMTFCTGFTPKWREVDLSLTQPNWTRFAPAARWLASHPNAPTHCAR